MADLSLSVKVEDLVEDLRKFRLRLTSVMHAAENDPAGQTVRAADRLRDVHALLLVIRESVYGLAGDIRDVAEEP